MRVVAILGVVVVVVDVLRYKVASCELFILLDLQYWLSWLFCGILLFLLEASWSPTRSTESRWSKGHFGFFVDVASTAGWYKSSVVSTVSSIHPLAAVAAPVHAASHRSATVCAAYGSRTKKSRSTGHKTALRTYERRRISGQIHRHEPMRSYQKIRP